MLGDKTLVVIPARMGSDRFPGKPLALYKGVPLVRRVYDLAKGQFDRVVVSSPDREIEDYCKGENICHLFSPNHCQNGTERCDYVYDFFRIWERVSFDCVVNWQVDEPEVDAAWIKEAISAMETYPSTGPRQVLTLVAEFDPFGDEENDPNTVKAAVGENDVCRWFSRAPMRGSLGHIGVYVFRNHFFDLPTVMRTTKLSKAEKLEQLTWMENGVGIVAHRCPYLPRSINTPKDLENIK
jgi:3-deoxy-manno-octulosonate cytidylyltransferase (CMP-KDO synthetase)